MMTYKMRFYKHIYNSVLKARKYGWRPDHTDVLAPSKRIQWGGTSRVCHILASGSSVINHLDIIEPEHFVIGFNYSALLNVRQDLLFIEDLVGHDSADSDVNILVSAMLVQRDSNGSKLLCKDIWSDRVRYEMASSAFGANFDFVLDVDLPPWDLGSRKMATSFASCSYDLRHASIVNQNASVLTLVLLAAKMGFTDIVCHGLDFVGPHFYFSSFPSILSEAKIEVLRRQQVAAPEGYAHSGCIWVCRRLPSLALALLQQGVRVSSAHGGVVTSSYLPRCLMV
jgi:hypothetical protein